MSKRITTAMYLADAKAIHGDRFDYSETQYTKAHDPITIICRDHGPFKKRACDHIHQKQGCPKCAHNLPLDVSEFSRRSFECYGSKYIVLSFSGVKHPATLACVNHGIFALKVAQSHFQKDGGCPTCARIKRLDGLKPGNISKIEKNWLDGLKIPMRQHRIQVETKTFIVDGFDPNTNTVYECYGSFWHGNPEHYEPKQNHPVLGVSFGELYERTMEKEKLLTKAGYQVVSKWVR